MRSRQIRRPVRQKKFEPALGRFGFDVLGSCLATVPAKQLRQMARERTKTRVSLAGQIHCGYLTQLHVGAGPLREKPYTGHIEPQLTREACRVKLTKSSRALPAARRGCQPARAWPLAVGHRPRAPGRTASCMMCHTTPASLRRWKTMI